MLHRDRTRLSPHRLMEPSASRSASAESHARVIRFDRAVTALRSAHPRLAEIAAACGYADQAHLTREFRASPWLTPKRSVPRSAPQAQSSQSNSFKTGAHRRPRLVSAPTKGAAMSSTRPSSRPSSYRRRSRSDRLPQRAFGAERRAPCTATRREVRHAELRLGNGIVMFGPPGDPATRGRARASTSSSTTPTRISTGARAGAEIVRAPNDTDYGSREYSASDPEGHIWHSGRTSRSQSRRPASEADAYDSSTNWTVGCGESALVRVLARRHELLAAHRRVECGLVRELPLRVVRVRRLTHRRPRSPSRAGTRSRARSNSISACAGYSCGSGSFS